MRQKPAEQFGPLARAVGQDLRNEAPIIVVKHRQRDPAEERKCMNVAIDPSLGNRSRIGPYKAGIAVRQVQCEDVRFLLRAANHHHRFAEVGLGMASSMGKGHKHLSAAPTVFTDVVLDRRVAVTVPARVIGAERLARVTGRMLDDLLVLDAGWRVRGTLAQVA